jgi:DnaJ family protein C protein 28
VAPLLFIVAFQKVKMDRIEDQIRKAMEAGQFDDLPGKGKPLNLDDNPYEDPSWRMANQVLRNAGFTLPWIETRQEIERELEAARLSLRRAWGWRQANTGKQPPALLQEEWARAEEAFRQQIAALNKRILSYNLQVPRDQFQLLALDAGREMDRL